MRSVRQERAEALALMLDSIEADICGLQHRVRRVRAELEKDAGRPCGYRYDERRADAASGAQGQAVSSSVAPCAPK